jgi:hypothetical protein
MQNNKLIIINNAISSWEQRYNGVVYWWDVKTYSKEWCLEQILYFKDLKTKNK